MYFFKKIKEILVLTVLFSFVIGCYIFGYSTTPTHPELTKKAIEVYKSSKSASLNSEQEENIIIGATNEDAPPRWLNHFYDPTTSKGLLGNNSAKEWASNQSSITSLGLDYSIGAILANYEKGNEKIAFQGLGHLLHLVQDMAVPAHTRLDIHTNDPYESWAKTNGRIDFKNIEIIAVNNIDQTFDTLAYYSHNNFFSEDTIPYNFLFDFINNEKDKNNSIVKYGYYHGHKNIAIFETLNKKIFYFDDLVHQDYWNNLAPKAISYSAGVIDYMLKQFAEIDKAKELEKLSTWEKFDNWLAKNSNTIKYEFGNLISVSGIKIIDSAQAGFVNLTGLYELASNNLVNQANAYTLEASEQMSNAVQFGSEASKQLVETAVVAKKQSTIEITKQIDQAKEKAEETRQKTEEEIKEQIEAAKKKANKIKDKASEIIKAGQEEIETIKDQTKEKIKKNLADLEIKKDSDNLEIGDRQTEITIIDPSIYFPIAQSGNNNSDQDIPFDPNLDTIIATSPPVLASSSQAWFSFETIPDGLEFECRFETGGNDSGWQTCLSNTCLTALDGMNSVSVRARNGDFFDLTPAAYEWMVDTQAPIITVLDSPGLASASTSSKFEFWADEEVNYYCALDLASPAICSATTTASGLTEGGHELMIFAIDLAGNRSSSTGISWLIDLTAPSSTLRALPEKIAKTEFTVNCDSSDNLSDIISWEYQYMINGGSWINKGATTTDTLSFFDSSIGQGDSISFRCRAADQAGNTGEWSDTVETSIDTATMLTARFMLASVLDKDNGKIYVVGGSANGTNNLNNLEVYDIASNSWQVLAAAPTARWGLSAQLVDNKIYVFGGSPAPSASIKTDMYNINSNSWSQVADIISPGWGVSSVLSDNNIIVVGGFNWATGGQNSVRIYDTIMNTWQASTSMITRRSWQGAELIDGKIYVLGGWNYNDTADLNTMEVYDPISSSWEVKAPMPIGLKAFSTAVKNGLLYVFGGNYNSGSYTKSNRVFIYDPVSDAWSEGKNLPDYRDWSTAEYYNGYFYIIGGKDQSNNATNSIIIWQE